MASFNVSILFETPPNKLSENYFFEVTTKDKEYCIASQSLPRHQLTVINIASLLVSLVDRLGKEFNSIESYTTYTLKNANEIVQQIKPKLGCTFESEALLNFKKLRLGLIQTALTDEEPEKKLEELLKENEAEIQSLSLIIGEEDVLNKQETNKGLELPVFESSHKIKLISEGKRTEKLKGGCKMLVDGKIRLALQMDLF